MEPNILTLIQSLSENLLLVVLAYGWMAERHERQANQAKYDRTLLALAGLKTTGDITDIVPTDKAADHDQRITKKIEAVTRD